jgi:RNA polymerase sigma-70 factor (ECF subfamily)
MEDGQYGLTGTRTMWARRAVPEHVAGGIAADTPVESERARAFRTLAEDHLRDSYSLASAILGNPTDAQDAVHDAVIAGWRKWASLRDPTKFELWFRRIVVNTCKERLRRSSRRRTTDIETEAPIPVPDGSAGVHDRIVVERGLAALKPDDRVVLALRYYHDLKIGDIAAILDIPSGTATSRLRAAHARLRDALQPKGPEESSS